MAATAPDRIVTLDVIRGIAVMGIFSVNVIAFAMIEPAYFNPGAMGGYEGGNLAVWFSNFVIIDGKMRSLFSMLFGASSLLVIDRAMAVGRSPARVHYGRMIVLALFGLIHFYFIWWGDILFQYAVGGAILFLFRNLSVEKLAAWSAIFFTASLIMMTGLCLSIATLDTAAHAPGASAATVREWNRTVAFVATTPAQSVNDLALYRSGAAVRAHDALSRRRFEPFSYLPLLMPETLALMLLGMAAFRSGFLTGEWGDAGYRKVATWTLGIGIAANIALAGNTMLSHFFVPTILFNFMVLGTPLRPIMALGYAALIILLFRRRSAIRDRIAAVGRCAFTNYLGTSILAALLFYGDGFGLYGRLSRWEAWLFAPLFWALMLTWSKPWLDRFNYGPFEWLWRSLARLKLQPMRKSRRAAATAGI
ncbi:MAG: DUF418 domain-containing protein [Sphingomicrobium sp.]